MQERYKRKFTESHSYKEMLILCKYLKNTYHMKFIVIGGGAFAIYTQTKANDLDIVVYDYGVISETEVDRVIVKDHSGKLMKIEQFGVEVDLLTPGQEYKKDGVSLFKIPKHFNNTNQVNGIDIVGKEDLIAMSKSKDKEFRAQHLK
jgi:hypothetical protein